MSSPPLYPSNMEMARPGWPRLRILIVLQGGESMANPSPRAITLTKNSQFYVRQGDVERLIQQGYLQRLT